MIERGRPGLIINTGSKQGITTHPAIPPTMLPRPVRRLSRRLYNMN
jgi:hypothetical protein